jgi:hypothetical protein
MTEQEFQGYMIVGALVCAVLLLAFVMHELEMRRDGNLQAKRDSEIRKKWMRGNR